MRRLVLFLLLVGALPVWPAVSVTSIAISTAPGAVGYSTALLNFNSSGAWTNWRLRVNTSSCASGTGGAIQADFPGGTTFTTGYGIIAGGLVANTHYFLCAELSDDGGGSWSSGSSGEVQVTTSASVVNEPRPVAKADSTYPNTGDFATMPVCPTLNGQNYCRVNVPGGTTDIRGLLDAGLTDQCSHGTVIAMPHSATPIAFTANTYSSVYADCRVLFWDAAKIVGNNIDFGVGNPHGLIEGQLLTFGQHGFQTPPSSSSCYYGNGFLQGGKFLAHIINPTTISLVCGDGSNNAVVISAPGTSASNTLFLLPHIQVTGTCPGVAGDTSCTTSKVDHYEVIIRSDAPDSALPPPGVRLSKEYCAAGLCSIWTNPVTNVGSSSSTNWFYTPGNNDGNVGNMSSNVRLGPGIEITNAIDAGQGTYSGIVVMQEWGTGNVLDRVYLHGGDTSPPNLQRWGGPSLPAASFEGLNTTIRDSYIDNLRQWHSINGIDGASITISRGPGPTMLYNSYIEGAGIPFHFDDGGATDFIRGDFAVIRNTFHSPTFMMHGAVDSDGNYSGHRQHLEFKAGLGIEIGGNVFDLGWVENNPNSEFVVITCVAPPGHPYGEGCSDMNMHDNTFKHGPGGVTLPFVVYGGGRVTIPPARFAFRNNLLYDIDGAKYTATSISVTGGKGWLFQGPLGAEGAILDHNTVVGNTGLLPLVTRYQNTPFAGWQLTNNFLYGFESTGWGIQQEGGVGVGPCFNLVGEALANACLTPSYIWTNNVMMSASATQANIEAQYPTLKLVNYIPASMSLASTPGWLQYDASGAGGNYGLRSNSQYRSGGSQRATDGTDLGIDQARLHRAQGHVRFGSVTPITATTAQVNFVAPDGQSCPVRVALTPWTPTAPTSGVIEGSDSGTAAGPRNVTVSGLANNTLYYGIILCAAEQPTFQFKTQTPFLPLTFADAIAGMTLQHDWEFGTGGGRNVTNITDLAVDFTPYGIAGTTPINMEWNRNQVPPYPGTFNTTNFVFTTNSLDLTGTIPGGGGLFNGGINNGTIFTKATWNPNATGKSYAFEGKLKIPNSLGMWPAFWFYPLTPGSADGSEVDVFEFYNMPGFSALNMTSSIHGPGVGADFYNISGWGSPCANCWSPGTNFSSAYHLYQLLWTPTATYVYVDGTLVVARNFVYTAVGAAGLITYMTIGSDLPGLPGLQPNSLGEFPMVYSVDHIKQWSTP